MSFSRSVSPPVRESSERVVAEALVCRGAEPGIAFAAMHSSDFGGTVTLYVANALRTAASGGI
jgi:hypothetical protein